MAYGGSNLRHLSDYFGSTDYPTIDPTIMTISENK